MSKTMQNSIQSRKQKLLNSMSKSEKEKKIKVPKRVFKFYLRTDQPTDRQTDQPFDGPTD